MFLKPKWYDILPDSLKPMNDAIIQELENFRKEYVLTDELMLTAIGTTKWAVRKIQNYTLGLFKKKSPHFSDKELWKSVIISRLQVKLNSLSMGETDPFARPLSQQEIFSLIENIDNVISNFRTFKDVVEYIINLDEKENRFDGPIGAITEVTKTLEDLLNRVE